MLTCLVFSCPPQAGLYVPRPAGGGPQARLPKRCEFRGERKEAITVRTNPALGLFTVPAGIHPCILASIFLPLLGTPSTRLTDTLNRLTACVSHRKQMIGYDSNRNVAAQAMSRKFRAPGWSNSPHASYTKQIRVPPTDGENQAGEMPMFGCQVTTRVSGRIAPAAPWWTCW